VCELAGRYWTDVRITTVDVNGHRLDVFRDRWSGFSVAAGTRTHCNAQAAEARMNLSPRLPSTTTWIVAALLLGATAITVITAWVRQKTKS
jgi:hypothetical protein